MSLARQIGALLRWEAVTEWRDRYGLASVVLYVTATVVIVYFAGRELFGAGPEAAGYFNTLYWIIVFFGAIVACGRSFLRVAGRRQLYYYTLASPEALLVSKIMYNWLVLVVLSLLTWALLGFFATRYYVGAVGYFLLAVLLGSYGLSAVLTFVSGLAARAGGSGTLMAVLSFPLVVPLLYLLVIAGQHATDTASVGNPATALVMTAAVDLLATAAGLLLFPFVWRD